MVFHLIGRAGNELVCSMDGCCMTSKNDWIETKLLLVSFKHFVLTQNYKKLFLLSNCKKLDINWHRYQKRKDLLKLDMILLKIHWKVLYQLKNATCIAYFIKNIAKLINNMWTTIAHTHIKLTNTSLQTCLVFMKFESINVFYFLILSLIRLWWIDKISIRAFFILDLN